MNLLVDIGNTRIKWRCVSFTGMNACSGDLLSNVLTLRSLEEALSCVGFEKIYLSNVGHDSVVTVFKDYAEKNNLKLHLLEAQKSMSGLSFAYDNIGRLGVDRCLAMIGAFNGVGVLVIDAGSAITADFIGGQGEHYGGYILPGYEMSRSVLLGKTAKVGVLADLGGVMPGQDTESCVSNGFTLLYSSLLERLLNMAQSMGIGRYVVTGGDAKMFKMLGIENLEYYENLVLDGLQKYSSSDEGMSGVGL